MIWRNTGGSRNGRDRHPDMLLKNVSEVALIVRRKVHYDDEGQTAVRRHAVKESLKRLNAAGRRAKTNNEPASRSIVGLRCCPLRPLSRRPVHTDILFECVQSY